MPRLKKNMSELMVKNTLMFTEAYNFKILIIKFSSLGDIFVHGRIKGNWKNLLKRI